MNISYFLKSIFVFCQFLWMGSSLSQPVARNIIVEHFTNTVCSICGSRNPGFYQNIKSQPSILHISYHPSSPYSSCLLNKHNTKENDSRTKYYGIYGSTPRLVIQGNSISTAANYSDSLIFSIYKNQLSSFELTASISVKNDSINVRIVCFKRDTSSYTTLNLFATIAEKTIDYAAPNGEKTHHDVFRKSFTGENPIPIAMPSAINDSVVFNYVISKNNQWQLDKIFPVITLQNNKKAVVQAFSGSSIKTMSASVQDSEKNKHTIYPNPAHQNLIISSSNDENYEYTIRDFTGRIIINGNHNVYTDIAVDSFTPGTYFLIIKSHSGITSKIWIKS